MLSGLDPCGGAGLVADIETINQFGLTPLPIATVLTVQNTQSVREVQAVDSALIVKQLHYLQADIDIQMVKIGLLASATQIQAIAQFLTHQNITIVLDPIVKSSTKDVLLSTQALDALKQDLLPLVHILTPNSAELSTLSVGDTEQQQVAFLPCEWILVTTTDVSDCEIEHRLYQQGNLVKSYHYDKLSGAYHGSGCTLSSAVACLVAQGLPVADACQQALDYTYQTLLNAKSIGKMQLYPNRQKPL